MDVQVKRLDKDLPLPIRAHDADGALDLRSAVDVTIIPGGRATVPTGIAVAVPRGFGGFVVPRSGLASRHGVSVLNAPGLVDAGYRGEVGVVLVNLGPEPFTVRRGDRIAQLAVMPVDLTPWREVDELDDTARGHGGFGSSGHD